MIFLDVNAIHTCKQTAQHACLLALKSRSTVLIAVVHDCDSNACYVRTHSNAFLFCFLHKKSLSNSKSQSLSRI